MGHQVGVKDSLMLSVLCHSPLLKGQRLEKTQSCTKEALPCRERWW